MKRDVGLKPREVRDLPPEKLTEIMQQIWPQEIALDLMNNLGFGDEKHENCHVL